MQTLTKAHDQLFERGEDERFASFDAIYTHCRHTKAHSEDRWIDPGQVRMWPEGDRLKLMLGETDVLQPTDWSFAQICRLARVSKDTVNQLSPETASRVFDETLPRSGKPLQIHALDGSLRSIHAASYTRLHNVDLLSVIREFATDFQPPQAALETGSSEAPASGLYCGEQDMFVFLIDPTGWAEINGEAFAPGFFIWNSEVGRRSVGIQSFWFQAVCQNHIVWDAVEVVEFSRKHTTNVYGALDQIRRILAQLVEKRDARRDGFAQVIRKAMSQRLGRDAEEVLKVLNRHGIKKALATEALRIAEGQGAFTVFALVDALTRLAGAQKNAGDRTESDVKAASLLALAS